MPNISMRKAKELSPAAKSAVESLLGRRLAPEEQVSVSAYPSHPAPTGPVRKKAAARLRRAADALRRKAHAIPDKEIEDLIDQVCDEVRHQRG